MHKSAIGCGGRALRAPGFGVTGATVLLAAMLVAVPASGEIVGPLTIVAESADGVAELRLDCTTMRCTSLGDTETWELDAPIVLRDANTGRAMATLHKGDVNGSGAHLAFAFQVSTVVPVGFIVTTPVVPLGPVYAALGGATAAISLTDTGADGAEVVGGQADGEIFRAVFNGDTTFATLLGDAATPGPFTSLAAHKDFPDPAVFSSVTESGAPLGTVSSLGIELKFSLGANDAASLSGGFEIAELVKVAIEHEAARPNLDRTRIDERADLSGATVKVEKVVADGPKVRLHIEVCAGMTPTLFVITSSAVSFPAVPDALARATVGLTVTDGNTNGGVLSGGFSGGLTYRAFYNDIAAVPATGTVFATLAPSISVVKQNSSLSLTDEFGAGGTFSPTDESAALLGVVSSISSQFRFTLSAGDCASGTSVFAIDGCGNGQVDQGETCDDGNTIDGDGCSANCALEGACCSDGPLTQSDCFVTNVADCVANAGLYLGDGTTCTGNVDCEALLVTIESMSAEATPQGVLVRWTTASEADTIGFRVLREDPADRREKRLAVVADLVPAAGNGLVGATYELFDDSPAATRALHYYIEDIDINGKVTRHGPVIIDRGERRTPGTRTAK